MNRQQSIITILILLLAGNLSATTLTDSIGYFLKEGDTVVIYEVGPRETLSSIALRYSISVEGMQTFNPGMGDVLAAGQIVKVPGAKLRKLYRVQSSPSATTTVATAPAAGKRHLVVSGETLYAIARKYDVSVAELIRANPGLEPDKLAAGQEIIIPGEATTAVTSSTGSTTTTTEAPANPVAPPSNPVTTPVQPANVGTPTQPVAANGTDIIHTVVKGETMYAISRQYKVRVTDIMNWNGLQTFEIREGQQLIVGKGGDVASNELPATTTTPADSAATASAPVRSRFEYQGIDNILSLQYKENLSSTYFTEQRENGIATWISDVSGYPYENGYFALHRTLPIGTIIKIRNLMNDRIIFAKIIGRLPDTSANERIVIKLPEAAKTELRALDEQTVMEISFLKRIN